MARRVHPLTLDLLERLEKAGCPCRACVTWAVAPVRRTALAAQPGAASVAKDAWISELLREWGSCGRVVTVDAAPVGVVVYAPSGLVPGAGAVPTAPASADAVLVTDVWVHPDWRGRGLGRVLVQSTARDLVTRGGLRAIEAFAGGGPAGPACAAPLDFYLRTGFRTTRPHPTTPRVRMDLRSTVTWMDEVESAIERLVGVVRPTPVPAPDPRLVPEAPIPAGPRARRGAERASVGRYAV